MAMNKTLLGAITRVHRTLFEATGGKVGGNLGGRPMLLLTTTGRKSGKPRVTPLQYMRDGDDMVVVASNGGNVRHPAWWHNIHANPEATAQTGKGTVRVLGEKANADERARLWPLLVESYPGYQDYEDETEREIPVVVLKARS
jgi:deazaflavin-dependent oxidoreductase (nitroreductase family)